VQECQGPHQHVCHLRRGLPPPASALNCFDSHAPYSVAYCRRSTTLPTQTAQKKSSWSWSSECASTASLHCSCMSMHSASRYLLKPVIAAVWLLTRIAGEQMALAYTTFAKMFTRARESARLTKNFVLSQPAFGDWRWKPQVGLLGAM
jgi:hypothetical protein